MRVATFAAIAALAAAATPASAQQQAVAGWKVGPIGGGCAMLRPLGAESGPAVMIQLSDKQESRVIFVLPGAKVEAGYAYTAIVGWDDKIYPVHMVAAGDPASPGLLLEAPDDRLLKAAANTDTLAVMALGVTETIAFPLTGAKEAAAALRACVATPRK
ncbi:hypothetical protein ACOYW6_01890 [Parablastomonas sp. CN1-191]|uniref:hypothetical protein n=1 Tax=Parablastomonas sp. CN1-191 TaxID=3400908 RepID=UPI003BF8EA3D